MLFPLTLTLLPVLLVIFCLLVSLIGVSVAVTLGDKKRQLLAVLPVCSCACICACAGVLIPCVSVLDNGNDEVVGSETIVIVCVLLCSFCSFSL